MHKKLKKLLPWLLAVVAASSGSALATGMFGGGGNTIDACVKPSNGSVRLLDTGQACNSNEQAISWNIQGPKGDTGPIGPQGLNWKGPYSPTASYVVHDAVQHGGSSWVAIAPVTGFCGAGGTGGVCVNPAAPPNPNYWDLLALHGDKGDQGDPGPVWRGAYSASQTYEPDDVVSFHGASYISTRISRRSRVRRRASTRMRRG